MHSYFAGKNFYKPGKKNRSKTSEDKEKKMRTWCCYTCMHECNTTIKNISNIDLWETGNFGDKIDLLFLAHEQLGYNILSLVRM